MTGFPQSTISSLESGVTTNIDYYITYAQALDYNLSKLFEIQIEYKPRFGLSANKKNRLFLTRKIKELLNKEEFFKDEASVLDVIKRLEEKHEIKNSNKLSTDVSRILLNWVDDGIIKVKEKRGRANIYMKVKKTLN